MTSRLTQAAIWKAMRAHMPNVHWTRIETTTGNGVPDLEGCFRGVAVWIEIKSVSASGALYLTPGQCAWHTARAKAGGRNYILAANHTTLWLWQGWYADMVRWYHTGGALPVHYTGPWPPDWQVLQASLFQDFQED